MPWCITCSELENPDWNNFDKRINFIQHNKTSKVIYHKQMGFIQYLKCKWKGHRCYL